MNPRELRPDDPNLSTSEILEQTERILANRHFRSAKSLERFLRHDVDKEAERRGEFIEGVFHRA